MYRNMKTEDLKAIYAYIRTVKPVKKSNNIKPGNDAKPGYYMLDKEGSEREGFPKYVYLGPNMPSDNRDEY